MKPMIPHDYVYQKEPKMYTNDTGKFPVVVAILGLGK